MARGRGPRRGTALRPASGSAAGHDERRGGTRRSHRRAQDLQALHRRRVPAHRVGPRVRGLRREGRAARQRLPRARARTSATRCARRARRMPDWAAKTAYNRSQILYRIAELMEGRRDQFVAEVMAAEGVGAAARHAPVDAAIDRWVWYAGWADKFPPAASARSTRSPAATSTSACPSRPAWSASSRPRSRACSAS